jgi:hypothetical protein
MKVFDESLVAPGQSVNDTITIQAPGQPGLYVVDVAVALDVR